MKSLTNNQMEDVQAGASAAGCIVGTTLSLVSLVLIGMGTAGAGVVAASIVVAEVGPLASCLL